MKEAIISCLLTHHILTTQELAQHLKASPKEVYKHCLQLYFSGSIGTPKKSGPENGRWVSLIEDTLPVEEEVIESIEPNPSPSAKNLTSVWLEKEMKKPDLMDFLRIKLSKKLTLSARISQIDDHIQEFLVRLISRDALKSRIEAGLPITHSHIAAYCVRSAYNDIRDSGTNPILREMVGARTEVEVKRGFSGVSMPLDGSNLQVQYRVVNHVDEEGFRDVEIIDMVTHIEDKKGFEDVWQQIEEYAVSSKDPMILDILGLKLEGHSLSEIGDKLQMNPIKVATSIRALRNRLNRHPEFIGV